MADLKPEGFLSRVRLGWVVPGFQKSKLNFNFISVYSRVYCFFIKVDCYLEIGFKDDDKKKNPYYTICKRTNFKDKSHQAFNDSPCIQLIIGDTINHNLRICKLPFF